MSESKKYTVKLSELIDKTKEINKKINEVKFYNIMKDIMYLRKIGFSESSSAEIISKIDKNTNIYKNLFMNETKIIEEIYNKYTPENNPNDEIFLNEKEYNILFKIKYKK